MSFVASFDLFRFCSDFKSKLLLAIAIKAKLTIFIWLGNHKICINTRGKRQKIHTNQLNEMMWT